MLRYIQIKAKEEEQKIMILLHGYGDNMEGMRQLANTFGEHLVKTSTYVVEAPYDCELNEGGKNWFSLDNYDPENLHTGNISEAFLSDYHMGASYSYDKLSEVIDFIKAQHNIDYDKISLVGFSQGAMIAAHTFLVSPHRFGSVCMFSGALFLSEDCKELDNKKIPILMVHGKDDQVIPYNCSIDAQNKLKELGLNSEIFIEEYVEHYISPQGLRKAIEFLKK